MVGTNFGIYRPNSGGSNSTSTANGGNIPAAVPTTSSGAGSSTPQAGKPSMMVMPGEGRSTTAHLSDFLLQLEDYAPGIPDPIISHYINSSGFETNDMRIVRFISIAIQKYVSDILEGAIETWEERTQGQMPNMPAGGKPKMILEDFKNAFEERGLIIHKFDSSINYS